ncbi:MAG: cytochrome c oxidase subunit II [Actinobacteria bacterium]|nr:cytochrome c oxidase subunit II [Actinomycetota bacterium]
MTSNLAPAAAPSGEPHIRRLIVIWVVLSAIGVALVVFALGPHMPPWTFSDEARDQRNINIMLAALATPVLLAVWMALVYSIVAFRQRGVAIVDGTPIHGGGRLEVAWIVVTTLIVVSLAVAGTAALFGTTKGAGGGQGPDPLAVPHGSLPPLQVQVIGQQWAWTFRYPAFGGVETTQIAIPAGRVIALHVTSLDVNHSFWAIRLGVKADAIPGSDNVAFVRPRRPGSFRIRCAELCGLWHGHMFTTGLVLTPAAFSSWIRRQVVANAAATRTLPPYSTHYFPEPLRRAG